MSRFTLRTGLSLATLCFVCLGSLTATEAKTTKKSKKDKKEDLPTLAYEQFRKGVEGKVAQKREEQIRGLKKLIGMGPEEREMPDLKFRLAELYFGKSQFLFFQAQEAEHKKANVKSRAEKARLTRRARKHQKGSTKWLQAAMELYRNVREDYPKYKRMPEVLFALGQAYWSKNKQQQAIEVYVDLIQQYPKSPLVAEAWIAFGEFYFEQAKLDKALESYKKAAANKRSRVYGFALYKQGWCYYNMAEWKKALRKFEATVYYADLAEELSGENKIALGREAQKDYVRTYSHVGEANRAKYQLGSLLSDDDCKGERCHKLLEQLARLWFSDGQFSKAGTLYRQLIELNPRNSRNPLFQAKIVDVAARSGERKRVIREVKRLVELYEQTKQATQKGGTSKAKEEALENMNDAKVLAEETIRKLAQIWNKNARKLRNENLYGEAKTLYGIYLKLFPKSKFAYEMQFQLGDLYYKLGEFDAASKAYEATVLAKPKGKYMVSAANDNILAIEEHMKDLNIRRPKNTDQPQKIHPQKQRLIDACDRYVEMVPENKAKKLVSVKYKAARVYYDWGHSEEAIRRFDEIATKHPKSEQAEISATLILKTYETSKNWKKLYEHASRFQKSKALTQGRDDLVQDLAKAREYAKFSMVRILEDDTKRKRRNQSEVAKAYESFYREFPRSENADKALYNAALAWDKSGNHPKAEKLRSRLLNEFKNSPLGADVRFHTAVTAEQRTDYDVAARRFLSFARKHPTDKRADDALYNAAIFYAGVGKVDTANKLRTDYLKRHGASKGNKQEAETIYFSIARDLETNGQTRLAVRRYAEFTKRFQRSEKMWEAMWNEAQLRRKLGQRTNATNLEKELLNKYRWRSKKGQNPPKIAAYYAGQVAFQIVDKDYKTYDRLRIRTPSVTNPKPFQRSLAEKAKSRNWMIKRYTKIVKEYQQPDSSIASLFRIANAWDDFVESLLGVPCPRGVRSDVCTLIKQGMEEQAIPAREAAYAAYKVCVDKSNELNVFNTYSTRCVKRLEILAPDMHPQVIEHQPKYQTRLSITALQSNPLILDIPEKPKSPRAARQ